MNRLFSLLFLVSFFTSFSQEGDYFITHYSPSLPSTDQTYFDITFSENGELIAANRSGLVLFDGQDWELAETPGAVISVAQGANGIYVGCSGDVGIMEISEGKRRFRSLAGDSLVHLVFQTSADNGKVYFLDERQLIRFDEETKGLQFFDIPEPGDFFEHSFEFLGSFYVQSFSTLYRADSVLVRIPPLLGKDKVVYASAKAPTLSKYAFASDDGKLFLFDQKLRQQSWNEDQIVQLDWLSDTMLAIVTLSKGVYFYDTKNQKVTGQVNATKGLPDNEIVAASADEFGGLWVANDFGFDRIAPQLPLSVYHYYPGLEGSIITTTRHKGKWYVGTSKGIYYFDQEDTYKNVVYYVPKNPSVKAEPTQVKKKNNLLKNLKINLFNSSDASKGSSGNKKNTLFSWLSNDNKKKAKNYERRVRKELVSRNYLFRPVTGVNEKCKKLISFKDRLIMVTPSGLIEINGNEASEIYSGPVKDALQPRGSDYLILADPQGGVIIMGNEKGVWYEMTEFATAGDVVISMYEDINRNIWLAGAKTLFRATIKEVGEFIDQAYPLDNRYFDNIRITELDGKVYLVNTLGYFYVDQETVTVLEDVEMMQQIGQPERHLQQEDGVVWVNNGSTWLRINSDKSTDEFTYLKLVPNLTFIEESKNSLWLVNDYKSLLKYTPGIADSIPGGDVFFKKVVSNNGLVSHKGDDLKFEYENNRFHIELGRPDYLGVLSVEYQFLLGGKMDNWSEWSRNNHIDFTYLPAGAYTLHVKSRDKFGRVQELEPLRFRIVPPYWQTAWFQALEVLFFVGLVFGSARMNQQGNQRHRILTSILTVLSVVLVIEFLQNLAGSYFGETGSPVLAFGIDVTVALLVFPFEQLLKKVVKGQVKTNLHLEDLHVSSLLSKETSKK